MALILSLSARVHRVMTDPDVASGFLSHKAPCSLDGQCESGHLCLSAVCTAIQAGMPACGAAEVGFRAGSTDILPEEHMVLDRVARCMSAGQPVRITIGPPEDQRERPALTKERARAVARLLQDRGAPAHEIRSALQSED
jgi:hypothetical protein